MREGEKTKSAIARVKVVVAVALVSITFVGGTYCYMNIIIPHQNKPTSSPTPTSAPTLMPFISTMTPTSAITTSTPAPTPAATSTQTQSTFAAPYPTLATAPTSNPTPIPKPTAAPSPSLTPTPIPTSTPLPTSTVKLGIYRDQACTTPETSYTWGTLSPGTTKNMTLYVRNEGNIPTTLTKTLTNFNPPNLSTYLSLNWDYNNQLLATGATVKVTLTLTLASNTPSMTNVGFNTIITATG